MAYDRNGESYIYVNDEKNAPKIVFGLFGSGGFAREVMPFLKNNISTNSRAKADLSNQIYFVETNPMTDQINGHPLISEKEFFKLECAKRYFNIAIGDSKTREKIAKECMAKGAIPMSIQSSNALIYDNNEIGQGAILCAFTTITSNAKIGKFFQSNIYSYVAHDCIIGDYVTFAPNVHCNGNVHIHNHAYIGTNVVIKQGSASKPIVIGEGAVIGMGAVVTKNVPPFTTVVGNPARPHSKS
jgi:sugar O-acyltransferase (sialic acid O-acetyltransferase NeuD family)